MAVTSAGPGREAVVGVRKSAGVILPRLLSSPLSLGTAWHVTVLMGWGWDMTQWSLPFEFSPFLPALFRFLGTHFQPLGPLDVLSWHPYL